MNPLAGKPLRCLIGAGDPPMGDDANIEVGYDVTKPSGRIRPKAPRALRFRCSIRKARPRGVSHWVAYASWNGIG
jgi:hypothetical protein